MLDRSVHKCPFCEPEDILLESELAYAKFDRYPAAPGHLLMVIACEPTTHRDQARRP